MAPKRVQLRRTKGWRLPPNTVVVARPSIYGNPFRVIDEPTKTPRYSVHYVPNPNVDTGSGRRVDEFDTRADALAFAVEMYREWATAGRNHYLRVQYFIDQHGLAGRDLACWCPLDQPCHADVLLELANPSLTHYAEGTPA
jgi:hypothetical protein